MTYSLSNQRVYACDRAQITGDLKHKQNIAASMVGYIDDMLAQFNLYHMSGNEAYPKDGADTREVVRQVMQGGNSVFEFKKDNCTIYAIAHSGNGSVMTVMFLARNYGESSWTLVPTMLTIKVHLWAIGSSDYLHVQPIWKIDSHSWQKYIHWTTQLADFVIRSCFEVGCSEESGKTPLVSVRKDVTQLITLESLPEQHKDDKAVMKAFEIEQQLLKTGAIPGKDYSLFDLVTAARKELKEP